MNDALLSSERMDWNTPQNIIDMLLGAWPNGVALDPCSNETSIVPANKRYTIEDDGLKQDWIVPHNGLIYINPPYGRELPKWAERIDRERVLISGDAEKTIVTLVPARTDTKWWRTLVQKSLYVCFLSGRVTFQGADCGAPFPSALVVHSLFTKNTEQFKRITQRNGAWVV